LKSIEEKLWHSEKYKEIGDLKIVEMNKNIDLLNK
jgi:hypothetical protein